MLQSEVQTIKAAAPWLNIHGPLLGLKASWTTTVHFTPITRVDEVKIFELLPDFR